MIKQVEITKIDFAMKTKEKTLDYVAEEIPLRLFINKSFWATILCSPTNLEQLAVGHFLSEGIIKSTSEIEKIVIKETENSVHVNLKPGPDLEARIKVSRLHSRVIPSTCGSGSFYQFVGKTPNIISNLKVSALLVSKSVNQLNFKAKGFRKTGGLHAAAIYRSSGLMVALAEDVGRHNAVDKVIGMCAQKGADFSMCFIALSGRMSGDVAFKAAKVGLPIVASLAAALSSGITVAKDAKLTLVGFVRGKRMNVYTEPERIIV